MEVDIHLKLYSLCPLQTSLHLVSHLILWLGFHITYKIFDMSPPFALNIPEKGMISSEIISKQEKEGSEANQLFTWICSSEKSRVCHKE